MGTVYRCRDETLDTEWAVKELDPGEGDEAADLAAQFLDEGRLLARLKHKGLPRVVSFFEENGRFYIVMDRIHGRTAQEIVDGRKEPLAVEEAVRWVAGLLDVLAYLHAQEPPVIVRDVSPSNLMIDQAGEPRLIDFGLARVLVRDGKTRPALKGWGSTGYAPPEQYGKDPTEPRSDLYAAGAIMWRLLSTEPPPDSVGRLMGREPLPDLRRLNPQVPGRLAEWVAKAMALQPEERFGTALEMLQALNRCVEEAGESEELSPGAEQGLRQALMERLARRLGVKGWRNLAAPPEPYGLGFTRRFGLHRVEAWVREMPSLSEEDMEAACRHARAMAHRTGGLLPSTLFVVLAASRVINPVAVEAAAADGRVEGFLRTIVFVPLDLTRRVSLDSHLGERHSNTNDLSDFILNLRIALLERGNSDRLTCE